MQQPSRATLAAIGISHKTCLALVAIATVFNVTLTLGAAAGRFGSLPSDWADFAHVAIGTRAGETNALAGVFGRVVHEAMPAGGPQALECYTYDDHPTGDTRLAIGCVNNVEIAGAGRTIEVRGGGVLSGPGRVDRWLLHANVVEVKSGATGSIGEICAFCPPSFPKTNVGRIRGVWIDDTRAKHYLAGETRVDRITFANGWQLRTSGDSLELWDAKGIVRIFR